MRAMLQALESYADDETVPAHWRAAAMPDAACHLVTDDGLLPLDGAAALQPSTALLARMRGAAIGDTLLARGHDATWRLRRVAAPASVALWAAQALSESRRCSFMRLRRQLAERLASQLLHELRNPMNALSLHADLLGRLIAMPDSVERANASARVIRERQRDLAARQDALVALWLAAPGPGGESDMAAIVAAALRMVRNYGSLHDIRLHADALDALEGSGPPRVAAHVELAIIAALLLACDGLSGARQELRAEWLASAPAPVLRIRDAPPADAEAGGFEWGGRPPSTAAVVATLALLLDEEPLSLTLHGGELRLCFGAAPAAATMRS
ncbi:hypothetical protein [Solimonas soli]|uniref:hypothetical protein n=1 Tax=Solimonas soli TaxID=413479 RepID=UPI0012F8C42A|nr:hypothetical protein [Solimonas soli]